ncbi:hypothetical protein HOY82DRAFT_536674 [Tuber indicum]|nr:hypothetical protein HOY82DRAFT_536674 [Tuber indicum]
MTTESSSTTSSTSTASTCADPDPSGSPGVQESIESIEIIPHPNLNIKLFGALYPGVFIRPPISEDLPAMTFPLVGTLAYDALEKELQDAVDTLIEICFHQELAMGGDEEPGWYEILEFGDEGERGVASSELDEVEGVEGAAWGIVDWGGVLGG